MTGRTEQTTNRLPRQRLVRTSGSDVAVTMARVSLGLLFVSACWLGASALRPLAEYAPTAGEAPDALAAPGDGLDDLALRASRLAALDSRGNLFSPDGAVWPIETAEAIDETLVDMASADLLDAAEPDGSGLDGLPGDLVSSLELSEAPPSAITRELQSLTLRSVFGIEGAYAVLIQDTSISDGSAQTSRYMVGDKIGKALWDLLAIDPAQNRVILARAGQTLELRMYDAVAARPVAADSVALDATEREANASGVVVSTVPEIRDELAKAGVSLSEIAALLALSETVEMPADVPAPVVLMPPAAGTVAASGQAVPARSMPAEMAALLRLMAGDAKQEKTDDAPQQNKDGGTSSEESEGESGA